MPLLQNKTIPLAIRRTLGTVGLGLLACALLGMVSLLRGENLSGDPPPEPPRMLLNEKLSPNIHAAHEDLPHVRSSTAGETRDTDETVSSLRESRRRATEDHRVSEVLREVNARSTADALPHAGAAPSIMAPPSAIPEPTSAWHEQHDAAPMDDLWLLPGLFRPDVYGRHRGEGEPLADASWLNRPYFAGFFLGGLGGDTLIAGRIDQSIGFFSGFRLGWDYDIYWGLETRLGFSELGLDFVNEPLIVGLATDIVIWDASLVYYPWGDSRWRPYVSLGVGLVDFDFLDENALRQSDAVLGVPLGLGLKYRHSDWITMRFDLTDNIALGERADYELMNNLSLTAGLEFRFGGTRKSYFPWNPSRTIR